MAKQIGWLTICVIFYGFMNVWYLIRIRRILGALLRFQMLDITVRHNLTAEQINTLLIEGVKKDAGA